MELWYEKYNCNFNYSLERQIALLHLPCCFIKLVMSLIYSYNTEECFMIKNTLKKNILISSKKYFLYLFEKELYDSN